MSGTAPVGTDATAFVADGIAPPCGADVGRRRDPPAVCGPASGQVLQGHGGARDQCRAEENPGGVIDAPPEGLNPSVSHERDVSRGVTRVGRLEDSRPHDGRIQ